MTSYAIGVDDLIEEAGAKFTCFLRGVRVNISSRSGPSGQNPLKMGPMTPPEVQTNQFSEPRPAAATRRGPEGQEASILEARGSNLGVNRRCCTSSLSVYGPGGFD